MNFFLALQLIFILFLTGLRTSAQVGIGTINPNARLDIQSSSQTLPSATDGILIPKINNFPGTNPTSQQDGMMVFLTGNGTPEKGFYYWNNATSKWHAVGSRKVDDLTDAKSDSDGTNDGSSIFLGVGAGAVDNEKDNKNVGMGFNSLTVNTSGTYNTAIGYQSLKKNINGNSNTAIGGSALSKNTIGGYNSAFGSQSLLNNVDGIFNTASGFESLLSNTDGEFNTAIGAGSLYNNTGGDYNTAVGYNALKSHSGGNDNTAIGVEAMLNHTVGSYNATLGHSAGKTLTVASGNVFIGYNSGGNETTNNNRLYIENSNSTTPLIGGDFFNDRVGINRNINVLTNTLEVGGEASKAMPGDWLGNSDRRLKKNIESIKGETALDKLSKMNGVSYEWNDSKTGMPRPKGIQYGFIAQELMEVFPEKVTKDSQGYYQTAYGTYDAFFVQAIKELKQELNEKEIRITELENKLVELQEYKTENQTNRELETRIEKLEALLTPSALVKD